MKIYWIKAQAPLRVLALIKHLGVEAETIEVSLMTGGLKTPEYAALNPNIVRWLGGLARLPAWADPWPAKAEV